MRIFRELRRREVLRTLGLYVGVCWLIIEAASVLLPTFDAPEWILRGLVIAAIVGFPITAVLAWVYDLTTHGISRETAAPDASPPTVGSRKLNFVVIGVLVVALSFSVYLNVTGRPGEIEEIEPITVLIADFENRTDDPVFDGVLEQALVVGLGATPHISLFDRNLATGLGREIEPGTEGLPSSMARRVAIREGIGVLLTGSIARAGQGYRIDTASVLPTSGDQDFVLSAEAADRDAVLATVASLSRDIRDELGDPTLRERDAATGSRIGNNSGYATSSIEAASAYTKALRLAYLGDHESAIEQFRIATDIDPQWGKAFAGWAVSAFYAGDEEQASALWEKTTSLLDTMTESERLSELGIYYMAVSQNYEQAVEYLSELVEKYPGSASGRNNLAVAAFYTLDFDRASREGSHLVELFPGSRLYRTNLALYAMYAGDFETAATQAAAVIEDDPGYGSAYLPLAIAALENGNAEQALDYYEEMAGAPRGFTAPAVLAGRADTYSYLGEFGRAREILLERIEREQRAASAIEQILLAESYVATDDFDMAANMARDALSVSRQTSVRVAAALVLLASGEIESVRAIAEDLSEALPSQTRAYGMMLEAAVLRESGQYSDAVDILRSALDLADLWRIRWELGRTYLDAGYFAEALGEFERCHDRRGEGTAMFLDDVPTFRYLAELPYWTARAQAGLGMRDAAARNYESYVSLRPEGGALADDARRRMQVSE